MLEPASVIRSLGIRKGGCESESAGVRECEGLCACVRCECARLGVSGCLCAWARTPVQGNVVGVSPHASLCICEYDPRGVPSLTHSDIFIYLLIYFFLISERKKER